MINLRALITVILLCLLSTSVCMVLELPTFVSYVFSFLIGFNGTKIDNVLFGGKNG